MNEELFRRMADEYVRQSGAELRDELDALSKNEATQITPALDRRVRANISAVKRRRHTGITGLIAACLMIALLIPAVLNMTRNAGPENTAPANPSAPTSPAYKTIPLSFTLPAEFSVSSVEQDIEKTVYCLENSEMDNVVMTLERAADTALFDELTPISVGGHEAYGSSGQGYSLLAFEKQDILYVLTCRHDINTLVKLSESILV